jgi:hypothetical protein
VPREPNIDGPAGDAPVYDADGVDRSLVRWMLSLTPDERLEVLAGFWRLAALAKIDDGRGSG